MADVLVGNTRVEEAVKNAVHSIKVPFTQGSGDATKEQTDLEII